MIRRLIDKLKMSKGQSIDRYYLFKLLGTGAFLHNIHDSDPANVFHTHPWGGVSIIFGNYTEERIIDVTQWQRKIVRRRRWGFNFVAAAIPHRVEVFCPTWTLFIHWRKSNQWKIFNREGEVLTEAPWEGEKGHKNYEEAIANAT